MESELCDIGVKCEEIEILDVNKVQEDDFEDENPLVEFNGYDFDVKVPNLNKPLCILEQEGDNTSGVKNEFEKIEEEDSAKQNNFNDITENCSVTGIEVLKTAQENSVACPINYTFSKRALGKKLHKILSNVQDINSSRSKVDVFSLYYKNSSKFAHRRTMKKNSEMAENKKVLKTNIRNSKTPKIKSKQILNNKDSQSCNNLKKHSVPKQSFIALNVDNLISEDSHNMAQNGSNKPIISQLPYPCPYCDFQTSFHNLLINHKRKHKICQPWACSKCTYSSVNKYALQRHLGLMHEKPQNIVCNECDFKCSRQILLKNHMLIHTHNNYFKCSECDYKNVKQAEVKRHMVRHLDNNFQLVCNICGYKGVKPEYLTRHIEKHHRFELDFEKSSGIPETAKDNVNFSRDTNSHLIQNRNNSIIEKQPVVLLRRCDDDINKSNNSAVNMGVIHEQILQDNFLEVAKCGEPEEVIDPEMLNCVQQEDDSSVVLKSTLITKNKNIITSIVKVVDNDKCTQPQSNTWKFKSGIKENIARQLKSKRGNLIPNIESNPVLVNEIVYNKINCNSKSAEVYRCKECSFVSTWFDRFETHVKLHTRECFSCDKCDFISNSQPSLTRHKRLKHSQGKDFMCEKCDYRCSTAQNLKQHMRCHEKAKRFKCNKCHIKCKTANTLKQHMSKHNGEKPFACDLCDFRTRYRSSLVNHRFVHTGETKYVCEICNYKFYANGSLKKHMEIHRPSK